MITKFLCWLFGHTFWAKEFSPIPTGNVNPITGEVGHFYVYKKLPFCLRCGKECE